MQFNSLYNPITATPFRNESTYIEMIPCQSLKPYIKCFWGTQRPITNIKKDITTNELIIPDTCMDIIFKVNYSENIINSSFIGINNEAFIATSKNDKEETASIFAIRFYAWTAVLFSDESMAGVRNSVFDAEQHYSKIKSAIEPLLFDIVTLKERVKIAEKFLLAELNIKRFNHNLETALFCIFRNKGNIKAAALANETFISSRQLERIFNDYIGVSPKQLTSLVRYQNIWNDILFNKYFNMADAVHLYGYTDQSHLSHDFKKFHKLLPSEAKRYALGSKK
ncbi:AraC family transcriptional regulator [Anaerocolumna cellulosilytica]|uniref:AraC family transcriptional regulator n=1 Tax=Anaerocolumna cellulosilytica TaxID=433286 RepID=A0A6S6R988_9FIRM|nr:helix-turn-helix domain-containing protein [Anaerocolumna cellulosilytica]MBB5196784.1 AraC-like DNA-binding protein [Anaerocolumna cellulosilytica]BCJ95822.1 AraC family transcriptional regulator [Anaerocolumna cellulosilytica]